MNARLEEFLTLYRPLFNGGRWDFFWTALRSLTSAAQGVPRPRLQTAIKTVFAEHQEVIMQTIAEQYMKDFEKRLGPQLRQEGRQEGHQEVALALALRVLHKQLGKLDARLEQRVRALPLAHLEEPVVAASEFRVGKDLSAWLRATV